MVNGYAAVAQAPREWYGSYLSEDAIVKDMAYRIKAQPKVVALWLDPESWKAPVLDMHAGEPKPESVRGALMFIGMGVRNYYGLWHTTCPLTATGGEPYEVQDGVITDPRHPDNLSGRIIERVRQEIESWAQ